jgi:murein DD-endopeptidase MepM/ murein hydrolase activator NlpD
VEQDFGVWNDWAERYHCGEDAQGDSGTAVYASADGEISHSGQILGYGWLITINHQNPRVYTLYGHLSTRRWKLEGGTVRKGDLIGYLGDGDEISGVIEYMPPHLHFGIREGSRFEYPGDASDNRWTAGFTNGYPTMYGWFDPTDFIRAHSGTP